MADKAQVFMIQNGRLVIDIPIAKNPQPSKSGKSLTCASTFGNVQVPSDDGKFYKIGLNCYMPQSEAPTFG